MALDLNEKPWYVPAAIGAVIGIIILIVVHIYLVKPLNREMVSISDNISKLEREIEKGRAAQRNLPQLEEDIRNYKLELDRLRRILPTRKETDALIKKLKQLMERGHFRLQSFRPLQPIDQEFYQEWPIAVSLAGKYHELGLFFDRLSRFSRIINVTDLQITPISKGDQSAGGFTINVNFTQQTFIYKEE